MPPEHARPGPPRAAIALVSGAALGYEVLLTRLLAVVQWHHFAYMVISLALLGFGASGTFLALARRRLPREFAAAFALNAVLFGLSAVGAFLAAQRLPFNALALVWEPGQLGWLLAMYLLLMLPFFFAANGVALAFMHFGTRIGQVYSADLLGAGLGAAAVVALLYRLPPETALRLVGVAGLAAAGLVLARTPLRAALAGTALAGACLFAMPESWTALRISPYKGLSQALEVTGARVVETRSGPLARLDVVASPVVPFREAPGLSLAAPVTPPPQLGVFADGESLSPITRYRGDRETLAYLDWVSSAAAYHVAPAGRVLVLGSGGGDGVLQAFYQGAARIDAVELNGRLLDLVAGSAFAGAVYGDPRVRTHVAEARAFLERGAAGYDIIQVALVDSFSAAAAGLHALNESHLYTVEALATMVRRLRPGGVLAVTRWLRLPPRGGVKLFATAVEALERLGVRDPGAQLAWLRSWNTTTLLVSNGPWSESAIERLRAFSRSRSFDLAHLPGLEPAEANRFNVLSAPAFFEAARALLGPQREAFLDRYKYAIHPATDDRPYFFNFFRWRTLPELLALRSQGGAGLLELGYLIVAATLVQAAAAGAVLILLPLAARRTGTAAGGPLLTYFGAIGFAFMFVEMAFIQKLVLLLGHPLYAVAVVLSGFLVFAGLGARHAARRGPGHGIGAVVLGIGLLAALYALALPALTPLLIPLADPLRVALTLALIAPLAFLMGIPFPRGLDAVARRAPGAVPWAWGINGCASVVSAVLATLLASHAGFNAVLAAAVLLYGAAAWSGPRRF